MIIFKNLFSFALTFKAYEWLVTNGTRATPVFNALGAVQVVVCALSVPMCMCAPPPPQCPLLIHMLPWGVLSDFLIISRRLRQAQPQLLLP